MKKSLLTLSLLSSLSLFGCDGASDYNGGRGEMPNGELTLSITDAAVDNASEVWVQFSAIELKPESGKSITYTFNTPMRINLLSLQGSNSLDFFNNLSVPSGVYNWVRLAVDTDAVADSYITIPNDSPNAHHELTIPSGSQSGLKINNGFIVGANSQVAMTIDFDLRKSVVEANGEYLLKPVLRLVDNDEAGALTGSIDSSFTVGANCSDQDPDTGNAVYVFAGHDSSVDDIDSISPDPVTTALMSLNVQTGNYDYEVGFLPVGNYTVAYTCMADLDDPEVDDAILFQFVTNATVEAPVELQGAEFNR